MNAISTENTAGEFVLINDKVEMEGEPTSAVAKFLHTIKHTIKFLWNIKTLKIQCLFCF